MTLPGRSPRLLAAALALAWCEACGGTPRSAERTSAEAAGLATSPAVEVTLPASTPPPSPEAAGNLRAADFTRRSYESACGTRAPGEGAGEHAGWTLAVERVLYGDLTGDGADEAVVVLTCTTGGTGGPQPEYHVFTLRGSEIARMAKLEGGSHFGGPEEVSIEGGALRIVRSFQDGNATPDAAPSAGRKARLDNPGR